MIKEKHNMASNTTKQKADTQGATAAAPIGGAAGRRAPRPLAVRERLVRGEVTADCLRAIRPGAHYLGGGDETELAIVEGLSLATGRDLLGLGEVVPGNVLLLTGAAGWDDLRAIAERHGISESDFLNTLICRHVPHDRRLVSRRGDDPLEPNLSSVRHLCAEHDIDVVIICGLWRCTGESRASAELFEILRAFARGTNTAVWLLDGGGDAATLAAHTRHTAADIGWRAQALGAAWENYCARARVAFYWEPGPLCRSRKEALARGEHAYFTGEPCKHGHVTIRYTTKNKCAECVEVELDRCLATALRLAASRIGFDLDRGDAFDHTFEMKNHASDVLSFLQEQHKSGSSAINEPTPVNTTPVLTQPHRPAVLH